MTNLVKISAIDNNRLKTLENRYDMLLEANQIYHHTMSGSGKCQRYLKLLLEIKKQIRERRTGNMKVNENSPLRQFLKKSKGLNGFQILTKADLFNLTTPSYEH